MKDGVNATPLPTVNTTGYIDHAAFLSTINPDTNKIGMVNITSSVNSRERSGINTILHELNPLFTINVTMRDIKSKNVYSRDRKSGSAGMPRPISYAVFCLKKKKKDKSTYK